MSLKSKFDSAEHENWSNSATYLAHAHLCNSPRVARRISDVLQVSGCDTAEQFKQFVLRDIGVQIYVNKDAVADQQKGCGIVGGELHLDSWASGDINWGEILAKWNERLRLAEVSALKDWVGRQNVAEAQNAKPRYDNKQIAKELTATALGEAYHGNALYVSLDIPSVDDAERQVIRRYLDGANHGTDHVELQMIANKIASLSNEHAPAASHNSPKTQSPKVR